VSTQDAQLPAAPVVPGAPAHLLVVRAPYYRAVVEGMTAGALRILAEAGATHEVLDVAGAFELRHARSTGSWHWAASCAAVLTITIISAGRRWRG
jgi:6,7-dimethyl-8-ribityllumazine synthase